VIPTVTEGRARWITLLTAPDDRHRFDALGRSLPAAARAVPTAPTGPVRLLPAHVVLRSFLDAVVDATYRNRGYPGPGRGWALAFGNALRDPSATFALREARWQAIPGRIAAWAEGAEAPVPRVAFALDAPDAGEENGHDSFAVRLQLHPLGEPDAAVPLRDGWSAGARLTINGTELQHPAEAALRGLARAAHLHAPLREALTGDVPRDLQLDSVATWAFLDEGRPALEAAGFAVRVARAFEHAGRNRIRARIRLGLPRRGALDFSGLLSYRWEVVVGDHVLKGDEFDALVAVGRPIVKYRGGWVLLDPAELARLPRSLSEEGTMPGPIALRAALSGEHDGVEVVADERFSLLLGALRDPPALEAPPTLNGTLRGYQCRGYGWLTTLGALGLGALLADDMGLGKTIQLVAHLLQRAPDARRQELPSLVVCPTSVLGNWQRELRRFAPSLRTLRWHGVDRDGDHLGTVDVVLTTYGLLVRDAEVLSAQRWDVAALDEAQAIKNPDSRRAVAAAMLRARHRVALTGTPVENRLDELWSITEFVLPGLLGPRATFQRTVAVPVERFGDEQVAARLRKTLAPFLLRRVKTDANVVDDLPDKLERREYCLLTAEQRRLYKAEVDSALEGLVGASDMERRGRVLAMLTALKQICNHPVHYLKKRDPRADLTLEDRSGKLERVSEIVEAVAAAGQRAVLFTQYREMGALLVDHLSELLGEDLPFLHGGTTAAQRDAMVRAFQSDVRGPTLLLVSLKAGGTGLNLTRATHVIHYDRWWNPAVEDQATDRAYRIGQHENVQVYKFVCEGTLEERIDQLLDEKRSLFDTVVGTGERWVTELDDNELRRLVQLAGEEEDP
jgi:superfamily II DNA or RNA helicase